VVADPIPKSRPYFSGPVDTRWCDDSSRDMVMLSDLTFYSVNGKNYTINKGQRFNGKSVPRLLWWTYLGGSPYTGKGRKSAPIHDALCGSAAQMQTRKLRKHYRHEADTVFYEMLEHLGVGQIKTRAMFTAVRIGSLACLMVMLFVSGCSTVERTVRREAERKIAKVARPIAQEETEKAISKLKENATDWVLKWSPWILVGGGGTGVLGGKLRSALKRHGVGSHSGLA